MSSTVEQVKARLSIVDVVSGYLKLDKAGANYRARCPFHQEKTPSFFVSPGRAGYHCFGCNRGGDLISFVQEIENLDFIGALKLLAERAGVPFSLPDPRLATVKERLLNLLSAAADYYSQQLTATKPALDYLLERGLTLETIRTFHLGLAPTGWRMIGSALAPRGFAAAELIQAGLLVPAANPYDRFRGRLMFPLADNAGRVVGFSARIFPPSADALGGKYINSPDTPLYNKSKLLYLYHQARLPLRQADRCILVEGQIDALLCHQSGFPETVAVSGTALTGEHLDLIKRLTNNLLMAFDADLAGIQAGRRAVELALDRGLEVKIAILPPERDPADLIRENPERWRAAVNQAVHVIDFLLLTLKRQWPERRELAHAVEREVYPFLNRLANPIDQAYFIDQIATALGLPESVIREGLVASRAKIETGSRQRSSSPVIAPTPTRRERLEEIIFGFIFWRGKDNVSWVESVVRRFGESLYRQRLEFFTIRRSELALAAELAYGQSDHLDQEFTELLDYWQEETWREELASLLVKVKALDGSPPEVVAPHLLRCQELLSQINSLKKI